MMKRLLITGANGMLGQDLRAIAEREFEVVHTDAKALDVTDRTAVDEAFTAYQPDVLLHLAAMTDVDGCETNPDRAHAVNAEGTKHIAECCRQNGAAMVYISTLAIFGGDSDRPFTETSPAKPESVYAKSKFQGEQYVQDIVENGYVVRAGWMFGGGKEDKKFVAKILAQAKAGQEIRAVNDKFGSPTYTIDFAEAVLRIIAHGQPGVYHAVNSGDPVNRYDVARAILIAAGIDSDRVQAVSSTAFDLPAPRPRMEAGVNRALEQAGLPAMRPWQEALQDYITMRML